jgi:hypothetical protein
VLAQSLLPQPLMAKVAYKDRLRMRLRAEQQALGG